MHLESEVEDAMVEDRAFKLWLPNWLEVPIKASFEVLASFWWRPRRIVKAQPRPCCELYDLVLDLDWETVEDHLRRKPQDAAYQDGDTWETPLYIALQYRPPLHIVKALLEACPEQALEVSRRHLDLPILIACRCQASLPVLEELLLYTEVVQQRTKYGSTVLTTLREGRVTKDELFWQKVRVMLNAIATQQQQHVSKESEKDEEELLVLHAAISLGSQGLPLEIYEFCLAEFGHQVFIKDDEGCLPLHIALGHGTRELLDSSNTAQKRRRHRRRPHIKYSTGSTILTNLLKIYPDAAMEPVHGANGDDDEGELPLHLALRQGYTWQEGVEELLHAAPAALGLADPRSGLYPFQLSAAVLDGTSHSNNLTTIFMLLRSDPSVVMNAIKTQSTELDSSPKDDPSVGPGHQQMWWIAVSATSVAAAALVLFRRSGM